MLFRAIGPVRTRDPMFTGRTLTAAEALGWGLNTTATEPSAAFHVAVFNLEPWMRSVSNGADETSLGLRGSRIRVSACELVFYG